MLSNELDLPKFFPQGFPVAIWKLREICANLRKTDILPEESESVKAAPVGKT